MKSPMLDYTYIEHDEFRTFTEMQNYLNAQGVITIISINTIRLGNDVSMWEVFWIGGTYTDNCE